MKSSIPNILTYLRLLCVPLMCYLFISEVEHYRLWCTVLFIVASITDWLDGYLARLWKVESPFGAFLDPIADKILVATALILLVSDNYYIMPSYFITIPAIIIISREILISALREWMAQLQLSNAVKVSNLGKYKTTFQMLAIIFLLYGQKIYTFIDSQRVGTVLLVIAAALTLISMANYLSSAFKEIKE